jgi:hypothetical protein
MSGRKRRALRTLASIRDALTTSGKSGGTLSGLNGSLTRLRDSSIK